MALPMTSCDEYNDKQYDDLFPYGPNQHAEFTQGQTKNLNEAFGCNTTWTSPDPFVASVDANGVMTARHVGQTWIQGQAQDNQYFGVTVNSTVNLFDNPAFDTNAVITFDDLKKIGEKYGQAITPIDDVTGIAVFAWDLEQKREVADDVEVSFAKYLVNTYKMMINPVLDEETGEPKIDENGNILAEITFKLLESNVVLDLNANSSAAAAADDLASQLTQWYENINSVGTIPGLVVYNNYTVETASMRVSVIGFNYADYVMVNYALASSTGTLTSVADAQAAIAGIPE